MDEPIACTLSQDQLRERCRAVLGPIGACIYRAEAIPQGHAYIFQAMPGMLLDLAQLIELERQCCRFLTFRMVVVAAEDSIRLEITGPPDATDMIADLFGSNAANT